MKEYRIVTDSYLGYEVQARRWWFPFWIQVSYNTHSTVEGAERWARSGDCVKYLGFL